MSSPTRAAALTCVLGQPGPRYLIERTLQNKVAKYGRVHLARYVFFNNFQTFAADTSPARKIARSYWRAFPMINSNIPRTCSMTSETFLTFGSLMMLWTTEEALEHTWFKEIPEWEWAGGIDILHDHKASTAPISVLCSHGNAESVSLAISRQWWIVSHLLPIDPDQR